MPEDDKLKEQAIAGGSKLYQSASRKANMSTQPVLKQGTPVEITITGTVVTRYTDTDVYAIRVNSNPEGTAYSDVFVVDVPSDKIKPV